MIYSTYDTEIALLALLTQGERTAEAMSLIKPEWFSFPITKGIFSKMVEVWETHHHLDLPLIFPLLGKDEQTALLVDDQHSPSQSAFYAYCKTLAMAHRDRKILRIAEKLTQNPDTQFISEIWKAFDEAEIFQDKVKKLENAVFDAIEYLQKRDDSKFIKSGFPSLDHAIGGFRAGELYTFGARPGQGKSTWMTKMALEISKQGKSVLFFGTEMSSMDLVLNRILPIESKIPTLSIRSNIHAKDLEKLKAQYEKLNKLPFWICDLPEPSLDDILFITQKIKPNVVMVDYLQRARLPNGESPRLRVSAMVRGLGIMSRKENIPILLVSALGREAEKNDRPKMSDLSESSEIERESHVVVLMWMDPKLNNDPESSMRRISAFLVKNRNGPYVGFNLLMDKKTANILEEETYASNHSKFSRTSDPESYDNVGKNTGPEQVLF